MSPEGIEIMTPTGGWMKLNDTKLKELGIDFFKSKTEWMPQVLTSFGGTVADQGRLERHSGPVRGRTRPQRYPRRLHGRLGHLQDHHDRLHRGEQRR